MATRKVKSVARPTQQRQVQVSGNSMAPFLPYHAAKVPKEASLRMQFLDGEEPCTTVMLRNIPSSYKQKRLIEEINDIGFKGTFDFFYLPMDLYNGLNVGYAFINFLTPVQASHFRDTFVGYKFKMSSSSKIANVSLAHIQGLLPNLMHFADRAVALSKDIQYRPVVMCHGQRRDFREVLDELLFYGAEQSEGSIHDSDQTFLSQADCPDLQQPKQSNAVAVPSLNPMAEVFVPLGYTQQPRGTSSCNKINARACASNHMQIPNATPDVVPSQNPAPLAHRGGHDGDACGDRLGFQLATDEPPDAFISARKAFEDAVKTFLLQDNQNKATGTACDSSSLNDTNTCTPRSSCASVASEDSTNRK